MYYKLFFFSFKLITEATNCFSPHNKTGICVDIRDCPVLLRLLKSFSATKWNLQEASFLRKSQCGFRNNSPYVCCTEKLHTNTTPETNFQSTELHIYSDFFHKFSVDGSNQWSECGISARGRTRDRNPKNATIGESSVFT